MLRGGIGPATQVARVRRPFGPDRPPRWKNVTFRVEEFVLLAARGRALRERGSLNGVINEFLEAYGGVHIPDEFRPQRRIPQIRRVRIPHDPYE